MCEGVKQILSQCEILEILNKGEKSIEESIKMVHFNDMRPEYNNIYISGLNNKNVYIYNGTKFIIVSESYALDILMTNHFNNIQYWLNRYKEDIEL